MEFRLITFWSSPDFGHVQWSRQCLENSLSPVVPYACRRRSAPNNATDTCCKDTADVWTVRSILRLVAVSFDGQVSYEVSISGR